MIETGDCTEIKRILDKLQDINTEKLLAVRKYSESRRLFNAVLKTDKYPQLFCEMQLQDVVSLRKIIKNKNKIINQFIQLIEELK